jgi:hypothetical protein
MPFGLFPAGHVPSYSASNREAGYVVGAIRANPNA